MTTSCRDCAWYHGLWPLLRELGIAASAARHAPLFARGLALACAEPRVLVSGAADEALLEAVLAGCPGNADLTVLDRCPTPLALCEAHAARAGRPITTVCSDVFAHRPERLYDVICSHSFVGLFPPARRRELFRRWADWLAPAGIVVVVNRLRDGDPETPLHFAPDEARRLCATLRERLHDRPPAELAQIEARAAEYVARFTVHPLSERELTELFHDAGLAIELSATTETGAAPDALSGIALAASATHALVVGRKSG